MPRSRRLGIGDVHLAEHLCLLDVEFQSGVVPETLPQLGEDFQRGAEAPHEVAVVGICHRSLADMPAHTPASAARNHLDQRSGL